MTYLLATVRHPVMECSTSGNLQELRDFNKARLDDFTTRLLTRLFTEILGVPYGLIGRYWKKLVRLSQVYLIRRCEFVTQSTRQHTFSFLSS